MYNLLKKANINIEGIKIKKIWLPKFINALFTVLTPNTVWINKRFDDWEAVDYIGHELKHREQLKRDGFIKYLYKKTVYKFMKINEYEEEAYDEQSRVNLAKRGV